MLQKLILTSFVAVSVVLVLPAAVRAYGAAHVGYTHVGPSGAYHTGETVARGPGGTYAAGHTTAYGSGGAAYHSSYGAAYGTTGGAAYGTHSSSGSSSGYYYAPSYSATATKAAAFVR